mgnify:CR=1 FL=1
MKGNPFGVRHSERHCVNRRTERVASFSSVTDVLDEYDGCSSVSELSQGPLFSPYNSHFSSQASSRTITPCRNSETDVDDLEQEVKYAFDENARKTYYQLASNLEESSTKLYNGEETKQSSQGNTSCQHSQEDLPSSSESTCTSGIGSSLNTTPANSPMHMPNAGLPRSPMFFIPANMRAEADPALFPSAHCCSIM